MKLSKLYLRYTYKRNIYTKEVVIDMIDKSTHSHVNVSDLDRRSADRELRKILCIYGIKFMLTESGIKQKQFAEMLGVKQKSVSVWLSGSDQNAENAPNLSMLLKMCVACDVTLGDLCVIAYQKISKNSNNVHGEIMDQLKKYAEIRNQSAFDEEREAYNSSKAHKIRLRRYENLNFVGYYYDTAHLSSGINTMNIKVGRVLDEGYIRVSMTCANVEYKGKIISPENQNYTYIYFERKDDFPEHGMIILRHPAGISVEYMGGIGCMLSLSKGDRRVPIIQRIALLNQKLDITLDDNFLKKYLSVSGKLLDHGKLLFTDLRDKNANYIDELKKMMKFQQQKSPRQNI